MTPDIEQARAALDASECVNFEASSGYHCYQVEWQPYFDPCPRCCISALLAAIDELTAEKAKLLDAVEVEYLERRRRGDAIGLLQAEVDDLEARNAKLEAVAKDDVRDLATFCIAQGASKPWQEIARRLLAALDALDD